MANNKLQANTSASNIDRMLKCQLGIEQKRLTHWRAITRESFCFFIAYHLNALAARSNWNPLDCKHHSKALNEFDCRIN